MWSVVLQQDKLHAPHGTQLWRQQARPLRMPVQLCAILAANLTNLPLKWGDPHFEGRFTGNIGHRSDSEPFGSACDDGADSQYADQGIHGGSQVCLLHGSTW
jgi:hypothetical protein